MKKEVSPVLVGVVLAVLALLIGGAYWWLTGRQEAGLPGAGEPARQPPAPPGMGAPSPTGGRSGAVPQSR